MDSYRYSKNTIEQSRQIYRILAKALASSSPKKMSYGEVAAQLGVHHRGLGAPLAKIQDECRSKGFPTITVYVVLKSTGLPSSGCDVTNPAAVERTMGEVRKLSWPKDPWW